jgi:hypothetical protein
MSNYAAKRVLKEAEQRMTTQPDNGHHLVERAELARVIKFMVAHDYQTAPPDADLELVAMIRQINDAV